MISQIPPNHAESPSQGTRLGPKERASGLVRDQIQRVELRGFEPLTPSMRTRCATGLRYSPKNASQRSKLRGLSAPGRPSSRAFDGTDCQNCALASLVPDGQNPGPQ